MELAEAIQTRRSIRRYQSDRTIPEDVLGRLLEVASWAPSSHNRQPWRFVVLTQLPAREGLARAMGERLRADRLADGDDPAAVEADVSRSYARITGAAAVVAVCLTMQDMDRYPDEKRSRAEYLMAVQSVAMAVQNLLLAAHSESLGACWMCAPLFCGDAVRGALDLPAQWEPQALVTLGYPAGQGKLAQRKPLAEVMLYR